MPRPRTNLIGAAEAATILGIHRSTLVRKVQDDYIPYEQKLPGHTGAYLFNRQVIELLARDGAAA